MHKVLIGILGVTLGLSALTVQPAEAAKVTWKVSFFDEVGADFGSGSFVTDTEPQTFGILVPPGAAFTNSTYTANNIVTSFQFQVGAVPWSSTEVTSGGSYTRWIGENDAMGRVFRSGYPTGIVMFGAWDFIDFYGPGRPIGKNLWMSGLFRPGVVNNWDMHYLEVPFEDWSEWYAQPENSGKTIPRHYLSGTWTVKQVVITPEPGMAGAGLMVLGLWGIRQRSRRWQ